MISLKKKKKKKKKPFNIGVYLDIYNPIYFELDMIIETTGLFIDISLNNLDLHSRSQFVVLGFFLNPYD